MWWWVCGVFNKVSMEVTGCTEGCVGVGFVFFFFFFLGV